jgi:hypothetical protein
MKTNTPHIDRPPRPSRPYPGTEGWRVTRVGAVTRIWFDRAWPQDQPPPPPDVVITDRVLSDEDLDRLRVAYARGVRDFSDLPALLADPIVDAARLAFAREHAPAEWKAAVGA